MVTWRALYFRPFIAGGPLVAFGRTSVGRYEKRDDRVVPWLAPGFMLGLRAATATIGVDVRAPVRSFQDPLSVAPALFLIGGMHY